MEYFDQVVASIHGARIEELLEAKDAGRLVVGTFCVFIPEEIVWATGGICVGLCAGAEIGFEEAEQVLPRNLCPLIKAFFGFKLARVCPYVEACHFVVGETTLRSNTSKKRSKRRPERRSLLRICAGPLILSMRGERP